jgi:cephalosporin hydroxylase
MADLKRGTALSSLYWKVDKMDRESEFVRGLSEFLAACTEQSSVQLAHLIGLFMQGTRSRPPVDPPQKDRLIRQLNADMSSGAAVPSFLHNFFQTHLKRNAWPPHAAFIAARYLHRRSCERFIAWQPRQQFVAPLHGEVIPGTELGFRQAHYGQGAGAVFRWRGVPCFKTTEDMAIYAMLIDELRPQTIIELGSGAGGSALFLADLCTSMGLTTKILSIDKSAAEVSDPRIEFIRSDCSSWLAAAATSKRDFPRPCLLIEDFHGDLAGYFSHIDAILAPDDYLFIEDSLSKQARISEVIADRPYFVDAKYTDFFGINCTSAINSIFVKTDPGRARVARAG